MFATVTFETPTLSPAPPVRVSRFDVTVVAVGAVMVTVGAVVSAGFTGRLKLTCMITGSLVLPARSFDCTANTVTPSASVAPTAHEALPEWFTEDLVVRVKERMRRLEGEWKGTPFGSTMTLAFEVD
jgi:hypothetical protein